MNIFTSYCKSIQLRETFYGSVKSDLRSNVRGTFLVQEMDLFQNFKLNPKVFYVGYMMRYSLVPRDWLNAYYRVYTRFSPITTQKRRISTPFHNLTPLVRC